RFVRARRRGETASVFLPSVPVLLSYAAELEAERDHVLRPPGSDGAEEDLLLAEAQRERDTADAPLDEPAFTALNASAHFDRVLYDGGEFGTATAAGSPEEEDFLGLPGLLDPDQVRTLLRKRQAAQLAARTRAAAPAPAAAAPAVSRQALAALRKELNGLVGAWSHRTGQPHGVIHADLRRTCGGPPLPQATAEQIRARIDTIRRWAASRR
ncbi:MAG TPA: ATP-dependent helicase, partial [Trebonia sp.]